MPRPTKARNVGEIPDVTHFRPKGAAARSTERIGLALDEFEAIRLADHEGYDHATAAELMNISRPTFSRLVERARQKVAEFIVEAKELVIEGGNVSHVVRKRCGSCGREVPVDTPEDECCPEQVPAIL